MIAALRMVNQRLWGEPFKTLSDVVPGLCAVQAQEFAYAKWTVAQRCAGEVTESEVDRAVADGTILRTHVMRPTWHFVAPEDIRWLLELTGPRVHAVNAPYYRANGVDDPDRTNALLAEAVAGGNHLRRSQMQQVLRDAGLELSALGQTYTIMRAELDGVICSGAPQGKQQTYALLEERAPAAKRFDRDEALAEITRRYFSTRGPATLKDFSWWSGLTQADGRRGVDQAGSLTSEVVNGRTYWFAGDLTPPPAHKPRVDLVQIYDEIGMSYTESRDAAYTEGLERQQPLYYHSILLNGMLIGHWRRTVKGRSLTFDLQLLRKLTKAEDSALEAALARFRAFAG